MLVSFHKTSPSPSLWSVFALVGLSTLKYIYIYIKMFLSFSAIILFTGQIIIAKKNLEKT